LVPTDLNDVELRYNKVELGQVPNVNNDWVVDAMVARRVDPKTLYANICMSE